jgi:hypothetical protein
VTGGLWPSLFLINPAWNPYYHNNEFAPLIGAVVSPSDPQFPQDWLAQFRRFWSAHVDALERHLDRMNNDRMNDDRMAHKIPTKKKTRKRR